MCGILGALPAQPEQKFLPALNQLTHRGPDGYGVWRDDDGRIILGHRRLSILDLSDSGKQPMIFGRYVITFNGEIFNFVEIRERLKKRGIEFVSGSDTEVLLKAYIEWGPNCLQEFNGMWAFAIWDNETKQLFMARDRFGIKPLYYAFIGEKFVFASEMKAIMPFLPQVGISKDFEWCKDNIFFYENTDKCLIEGIKRFPSGHYANFDSRTLTLSMERYWNTMDHLMDVSDNYEDQVEQFREIFFDACKIRMRSDVPVGSALSGGLDSSSVVSAMANINRQGDSSVSDDWQHAFVATFPNTELDESHYAKMVTDNIGIDAFLQPIDPAEGINKLEDYLWILEDLYLTSPIPMVEIYKTIKAGGVTVTLDGHGADEMFSSYGGALIKAVGDCPFEPKKINQILDTFYSSVGKNPADISFGERISTLISGYGKKNLAKDYLRALFRGPIKEAPTQGKLGLFNQLLYRDFHEVVLPTLLRNYDRYSMAASVEVRMPFMDYRLVNFCFSIPWHSKIRNGYTKSLIRDAMAPYMPAEVTWRKHKLGFNTPFKDWIQGPWRPYIMDMMHSSAFKQSDLITASTVQKQVEKVMNDANATFHDGESAWKSLMPYLWEKSVLKRSREVVL